MNQCTNSRCHILYFPTHQEPGYELGNTRPYCMVVLQLKQCAVNIGSTYVAVIHCVVL